MGLTFHPLLSSPIWSLLLITLACVLSTGKTEELIIRKLQDISTKRKWRGPSSTASSSSVSPNKTISLRSARQSEPKSLAPGLKLKVVATPVPHSIPQKPAPQRPKTSPIITPPSSKHPSTWRSPGERTRPNILSRRKIQPAPGEPPVPLTLLLSISTQWARLTSIRQTAGLETELSCEEMNHLDPFFCLPNRFPTSSCWVSPSSNAVYSGWSDNISAGERHAACPFSVAGRTRHWNRNATVSNTR